jgi:hypothetical protein
VDGSGYERSRAADHEMKDVDIGDQMNASKTKWVGMVFAVSALVAGAGETDACAPQIMDQPSAATGENS